MYIGQADDGSNSLDGGQLKYLTIWSDPSMSSFPLGVSVVDRT